MSKIMTVPKNKDMIKKLIKTSDAFLIGIKDLSINFPNYFTLDEIYDIAKFLEQHNKELFISLNKNYKNKDIKKIEEVMCKINKLKVEGVFYYDVAILNIWKRHRFKYNLVWAQEHFVTNYTTANYYNSIGVKYGLLSSEITYKEIQEMLKNSKMKFILPLFGYTPMFASHRHLVDNYLNHFNVDKKTNNYFMKNKENKFQIIDDNNGTVIYSSNIINGLPEYLKLKKEGLQYVLLNSFSIDDKKYINIVNYFNNVNYSNVKNYEEKINEMYKNIDKGFLYKETIYKVKCND